MILETKRLIIKELDHNNAQFIIQLVNSPGWIQFIGDRNIRSKMEAINYINIQQENYTQRVGLYAINIKGNGSIIGLCGFLKRDYLDKVDIGYALLPEYYGNGYAFEAISSKIKKAFETAMTDKIYAITKPDNISSIKLLVKLNFHKLKEIKVKDEELEVFILEKI